MSVPGKWGVGWGVCSWGGVCPWSGGASASGPKGGGGSASGPGRMWCIPACTGADTPPVNRMTDRQV